MSREVKTEPFIVQREDGLYMVKSPYWNAGKWSDNPAEAEIQIPEDRDFFIRFYPKWKMTKLSELK